MAEELKNVSADAVRRHVQQALVRYWPKNVCAVSSLPIPIVNDARDSCSPQYVLIEIPDWASECAVDGCLLVPKAACKQATAPSWDNVDWWLAAFLMMECWPERFFERRHGVIHSVSRRLNGWDTRTWERAWVNRIAIFLRLWAAHAAACDCISLFGPLPEAKIIMTHDVDAIRKTVAIRSKQSAFNLYNAFKLAMSARFTLAEEKIRAAIRFIYGSDNWCVFDDLLEMERAAGINAVFHFYADDRCKTFKRWLFDPGYDIQETQVRDLLHKIDLQGSVIGLHGSFDSWDSSDMLLAQKERLAKVTGFNVTKCRQHWLCFGWDKTWSAQESAGIALDTTLMFNDRPGFRGAAALCWHPWNEVCNCAHKIKALPSVFMDSHFYDYQPMSHAERRRAINYWIDEIKCVGGEAAVLWHPHTLSSDYGWNDGFAELLRILNKSVNSKVYSQSSHKH